MTIKSKYNSVLTDNNIGDEGCIMLSESLKSNSTLKELYLTSDEIIKVKKSFLNDLLSLYNNIGVEGSSALGEALMHNSTLKRLDLVRSKRKRQYFFSSF